MSTEERPTWSALPLRAKIFLIVLLSIFVSAGWELLTRAAAPSVQEGMDDELPAGRVNWTFTNHLDNSVYASVNVNLEPGCSREFWAEARIMSIGRCRIPADSSATVLAGWYQSKDHLFEEDVATLTLDWPTNETLYFSVILDRLGHLRIEASNATVFASAYEHSTER